MPGFLATTSMATTCSHQTGVVTCVPSNARVLASGQPVATTSDQLLIAGCLFLAGTTKPQPCVRVQLQSAARVLINLVPALLHNPTDVCLSAEQAPQGPPMTPFAQSRVAGM